MYISNSEYHENNSENDNTSERNPNTRDGAIIDRNMVTDEYYKMDIDNYPQKE